MAQILEALRRSQAENAVKAVPTSQGRNEPLYAGLVPPDYTKILDTNQESDWSNRMKSIEIIIPELPTELGEISELSKDVTSTDDFPDNSWANKDAICLEAIDSEETINLGRKLISSLAKGSYTKNSGLNIPISFPIEETRNWSFNKIIARKG